MIREYSDATKTLTLRPETEGEVFTRDILREYPRTEHLVIGSGCVFNDSSLGGTGSFSDCIPHVESIDMSEVDATSLTFAEKMFKGCVRLSSVSLPPMPNVINASEMFSDARSIEHIDLTGLGTNVRKVYLSNIFLNCHRLQDAQFAENLQAEEGDALIFDTTSGDYRFTFHNEVYNMQEYVENTCYVDFNSYRVFCQKKSLGYTPAQARYAADILMQLNIDELDMDEILEKGLHLTPDDNANWAVARNNDDLEFFREHREEYDSLTKCYNLVHAASLDDSRLLNYHESDRKFEPKKKFDVEELLNALKTGDLQACYVDLPASKSLKKSSVLFFDRMGYIVYECKQKELDERFPRFIRGYQKQTGTQISFHDYIEEMDNHHIPVDLLRGNKAFTAYAYALCMEQRFIPNTDFLNAIGDISFNNQSKRPQLPQTAKELWDLYRRRKCFNRNEETTRATMNLAGALGAFEQSRPVSSTAMNYLRSFATYIPETISMDGYNLAKYHPEVTPMEIERGSEITIRPGIPYKAKKAHAAILDILSEDEVVMGLLGDRDNLDKYLKKIEPLAELMDNVSVECMQDGPSKTLMQRIVKDLYVDTRVVTVPVNKQELASKEEKEKFWKLTETMATEEDVNMHVLDSRKMHALFDGLKPVYNADFAKFLKNHMRDILYDENPWQMGYKLKTIQNQWDYIQNKRLMNRREFKDTPAWKMSFAEITRILNEVSYERYDDLADEKYDEIADLCYSYSYDQNMFERTCRLYDKMCERHTTSIPSISGEYNGYTYRFLDLEDPAAIFFGQILNCCQQYGDAGESCMLHSCESKNGRVFGVFNENGIMVAGSWTWRNGDTVCFDNIEVANNPESAAIVEVYAHAAEQLHGATAEGDVINKVTAGLGYTDIPLDNFERDDANIYPIEEVRYISDSRHQVQLFYTGAHTEIATNDLYESMGTEHVNASLGQNYGSTAGTLRNRNRFNIEDFDREEDDDDYEERHDDKVIDDDIDDCEIIERVVAAESKFFENERER